MSIVTAECVKCSEFLAIPSKGCNHEKMEYPDGISLVRYPCEDPTCNYCGVDYGDLHHFGCISETCPRCRGELEFCGCLDRFAPIGRRIGEEELKVEIDKTATEFHDGLKTVVSHLGGQTLPELRIRLAIMKEALTLKESAVFWLDGRCLPAGKIAERMKEQVKRAEGLYWNSLY